VRVRVGPGGGGGVLGDSVYVKCKVDVADNEIEEQTLLSDTGTWSFLILRF